jgi:N-acetylmuramoyl-L-alanine amidase
MPVALAEIGFITNEDERKKMLSDDYQQKCADAICQSMEEYLQKIRKK